MGGGSAQRRDATMWVVAVALALLAAAAVPGGAAGADPADPAEAPGGLEVAAVDTSDYPAVGLTVIARDEMPGPEDVSVTEDGATRPATVAALDDRPLEVVAVVDTSEGVGDRLRAVVAAVTEFALRLPPDARIGVVAAAGRPQLAIAPTRDTGAVLAALAELEASGDPAVLEAVPVALDQLSSDGRARRAVVAVAGDAGVGDRAREEFAERVRGRDALLFAVAVPGDVADGLATGGASVREIDGLAEASDGLRRVVDDLDGLYRLEFTAEGSGPTEVAVAVGDQPAARTTAVVTLPAEGGPAAAPAAPASPGDGGGEGGLADRFPDSLLWPGYALASALLLWLAWVLDERRARVRRRHGRLDRVAGAASHLRAAARRTVRGRRR